MSQVPDLWPHQREAIDFASASKGGTAWDIPMAYGKSRAAVVYAEENDCRRVMVMTPPSPCVEVWERAILDWATEPCYLLSAGSVVMREVRPDKKVVNLRRKPTTKQKAAEVQRIIKQGNWEGVPVYIASNYESWRADAMRKIAYTAAFDLCIADEFHKLKSPFGVTAKFAAQLALKIPDRLGLSGTIIPHSPLDVFGEYRFIDPTVFGTSFVRFRNRYCKMGGWKNKEVVGYQNQEELAARMATCTYTAPRGAIRLPGAEATTLYVDLGAKNQRAYDSLESVKVAATEQGAITAVNAASELHGLMQLANGYGKDDITQRRVDFGTDKRDTFAEILQDTNEPVVAFYVHNGEGDDILRAAEEAGRRAGAVRGGRNDMALWDRGEIDVMAVQIQAGSNAIDLTRASLGVFYSLGWSNSDYEQAKSRLVRTTQKSASVRFIHLVARNTIEEKVSRCQILRRDVIEGVLQYLKTRS